MYRSADHFQYSYPISNWRCSCHGNRWVGLTQLTCCSKKSSVGKISGLKSMSVWSGRRWSIPKNWRGKSSKKTKPALLSTCCGNSFNGCELIYEPRTVADFYTNKTLLPVGTTRDWTEQLDHNKSRHGTLATEVNVDARRKKLPRGHYWKIDMWVEIGTRDCLRNNDIYYGGLRENRYLHYGGSLARLG